MTAHVLAFTSAQAQSVEAIMALDFGQMRAKMADKLGWSDEKLDRIELLYKRFLILALKYPNRSISPSEIIDEFWHFHILDTERYTSDCNQIFGRYLHHYPYFGRRGDEDRRALDSAYGTFRDLYQAEFGEEPVHAGPTAANCIEIPAGECCPDHDDHG